VVMHGANGTFNNMVLVKVSLQWTIIGLIYVMHVISCYCDSTWRSNMCLSCIIDGMTISFIRNCGTNFSIGIDYEVACKT